MIFNLETALSKPVEAWKRGCEDTKGVYLQKRLEKTYDSPHLFAFVFQKHNSVFGLVLYSSID